MASWYDSNYKYRAPFVVMNSGGGTTIDAGLQLPTNWDHFWSNVQSTGYDIRVCDADGVTLLTYDREAFNYANKVLLVEVDAITVTADKPHVLWLYWGYTAATDGITVFVPTFQATRLAIEKPPQAYTITAGIEPPGATKPRNTITKNSSETIFVYWDVTDLLARRQEASQSSQFFEAIQEVVASSVLVAGADQAAMHSAITAAGVTRVIEHLGRIYIRTDAIGGATATDYTLELKFTTILNKTSAASDTRTITTRALLMVRDVSEV